MKSNGKRIISSPTTSEEEENIAPLSKKLRISAATPFIISPVVEPKTQLSQIQNSKSKITLNESEELEGKAFVESVIVSDS